MRIIRINRDDYAGKISYPDSWCFAFNDQYIEIELTKYMAFEGAVTVSAGNISNSISIALYKGRARIYVSKLMQMLFTDYKQERCVEASLSVTIGADNLLTAQTQVLWGKMHVGDQFCSFGDFIYDESKAMFQRELVWFVNLPFQVSAFRRNESEKITAYIGHKEAYNIPPIGPGGFKPDPVLVEEDFFGPVFRYPIVVNDTDDAPDFPDDDFYGGSIAEVVLFAKQNEITYYTKVWGTDEWQVSTKTQYDSAPDDSKYMVAHGGTIMARDEGGSYGTFWLNNPTFGSWYDYMVSQTDWSPRHDTEWDYNGNIVRWDDKNDELVFTGMGNSGRTGIFELNPRFSFMEDRKAGPVNGKYAYGELDEQRLVYDVTPAEKPYYTIYWDYKTTGVFDETFDFTFDRTYVTQQLTERIVLEKREDTVGFYLRWIDRFGYLNYFLFAKGDSTLKSTVDSNSVDAGFDYGGLYFDARRALKVESQKSIKCAAVNLTQAMVQYVESIVESPHVDLYLGKTKSGKEIWVPAQVTAGSYKTSNEDLLQDYEITLTLTKESAQTF